jgi:hypothetical protein
MSTTSPLKEMCMYSRWTIIKNTHMHTNPVNNNRFTFWRIIVLLLFRNKAYPSLDISGPSKTHIVANGKASKTVEEIQFYDSIVVMV